MANPDARGPAAVILDLDGVLIDSEAVWDEARRELAERSGGTWRPDSQRAMMGMSSTEWSRYMHEELGVPMSAAEISAAVIADLERRYREGVPMIPGAREAVIALAGRWPLGLASSANRPIIDLVLREADLARYFQATVSSEEVARGKPAPDVYLEAAAGLSVDPADCAAVEDSANGLRAAAAAGMRVVAIPNREFPPDPEALALADLELGSIEELTPGAVAGLSRC
jgi:HAD superfamily hydrolase (TIGR01509 family)